MVSMYFGIPGCGKSTLATKIIKKNLSAQKYKHIYVNFPVTGMKTDKIKLISNDDFGKYDLSDSLIVIDEATIFADSRAYKTFNKEKVEFLLLHRHYHCDILLFSQGYNAVDKKLRDLTVKLYYIQKCRFFRSWSKYYPIKYGIMFPEGENLGEIAEGYQKPPFLVRLFTTRHIYRPLYYKYFDSYDAPSLPPLP